MERKEKGMGEKGRYGRRENEIWGHSERHTASWCVTSRLHAWFFRKCAPASSHQRGTLNFTMEQQPHVSKNCPFSFVGLPDLLWCSLRSHPSPSLSPLVLYIKTLPTSRTIILASCASLRKPAQNCRSHPAHRCGFVLLTSTDAF